MASLITTIVDIKHDQQRYNTIGDWIYDDKGNLLITVSRMNNWKYEFLIAFHEQIESALCKARGISQEDVDNFDMEFESRRQDGDFSEPGDSQLAPYHKEHMIASVMERAMAIELDVEWEEYDKTVS